MVGSDRFGHGAGGFPLEIGKPVGYSQKWEFPERGFENCDLPSGGMMAS
jgi:hypothetical protein